MDGGPVDRVRPVPSRPSDKQTRETVGEASRKARSVHPSRVRPSVHPFIQPSVTSNRPAKKTNANTHKNSACMHNDMVVRLVDHVQLTDGMHTHRLTERAVEGVLVEHKKTVVGGSRKKTPR